MSSPVITYVDTELQSMTYLDQSVFLVEIHLRKRYERLCLIDGEIAFGRNVGDAVGPASVMAVPSGLLFSTDPSSCIRYLANFVAATMNLDSSSSRRVASKIAPAIAEEAWKLRGVYGFWMVVQVNVVHRVMVSLWPPDNLEDVQVSNPGASSSSAMEKLKRKRFFMHSTDGSKDTCPVCLDEFSTEAALIPLPCSHVFHEGCIFRWLEKHETCPLCRREV